MSLLGPLLLAALRLHSLLILRKGRLAYQAVIDGLALSTRALVNQGTVFLSGLRRNKPVVQLVLDAQLGNLAIVLVVLLSLPAHLLEVGKGVACLVYALAQQLTHQVWYV